MKISTTGLFLAIFALTAPTAPAQDKFITLSNTPMGTLEAPLILRTYFPDPGLGRETLANHALGARARKYTPGKGDVEGFVDPIPGIPGAIGVNFGPALSICWDTTECRLLYAWQGGFLNMANYWGEPESGRRGGFNYLPSLEGQLIYLAKGSPPLGIFDTYTKEIKPEYLGYELEGGVPEFSYRYGEATVHVRIEPGKEAMTLTKHYKIEGATAWGYTETGYSFRKSDEGKQSFTVTIQGKITSADGSTVDEPVYSTKEPNSDWGESLYTSLGCFVCHSSDGTRGHGPTFSGLFGSTRPITGSGTVVADAGYLRESIANPMAKVVETFPAGYMPPYPIDPMQVDSLILFIQSLANE